MAASLKSTSDGATLVLTISNPEQHNALGPDIYAAGVEAITAAETNPDVRSVVIAGSLHLAGLARPWLRARAKAHDGAAGC